MKIYREIFLLFCLVTIFPPLSDAGELKLPTYGVGDKELLVFTDYFCPPCMKMETELSPALKKALEGGGWRVTFVDIPGHQDTPLFARYFIYAVQGGKGYKNALAARDILFDLARQGKGYKEKDLEEAFKRNGVRFKVVDPWPVYKEWNRLMEEHKISGTPTCILKEAGLSTTVFDGSKAIRERLLPLLIVNPPPKEVKKK
jgi:thiol:disulfide interchange protein DsbA